jgi:hypothetical protein
VDKESALKKIEILTSPRGHAALDHVEHMYETHGRHSITSCPPGSRAMCDYADILGWLEDEIVPDDL